MNASYGLTTSSSPDNSSTTAAAPDAEQAQLAAAATQCQSPAAAAEAPCKQSLRVFAAAHDSCRRMRGEGLGTDGPADASAAVVPPQLLASGVEGGVPTPASGPTTAPVPAAEAALAAAPAEDATPASARPGLPQSVGLPTEVNWFHIWVYLLAELAQVLIDTRTLSTALLVCHALWPTAARKCCMWSQRMRTLSQAGMPLLTGPRRYKGQKQTVVHGRQYQLQDEHRIAYTLKVWALRLLVAGVWRAAGAAAPEEMVVYLPLTEATSESCRAANCWGRHLALGQTRLCHEWSAV